MKNLFKLFGIIALIAVIGFSMIACDNGDDGGGGSKDALDGTTWKTSDTDPDGAAMTYVLTFNSPNFTWTVTETGKQPYRVSGTYSISGSTVTLNATMNGESSSIAGTLSGNTLTVDGGLTLTKQ